MVVHCSVKEWATYLPDKLISACFVKNFGMRVIGVWPASCICHDALAISFHWAFGLVFPYSLGKWMCY